MVFALGTATTQTAAANAEWVRRLCHEEQWEVVMDAVSRTPLPLGDANLLRVAVQCRRVPLQVLQSMTALDPHWIAATHPATTGTVLHEAIQYQCLPEVQHYLMREMYRYHPNLLHVQDGRGRTALHCLLQQSWHHPHWTYQHLCRKMWSMCPTGTCLMDQDGSTPLMLLLQQTTLADVEILSMLQTSLSQLPSIASLAHTRKTPYRNPYSVPGVIQTIQFSTTPLYYAILSGRSVSIVSALLTVTGPSELSRTVTPQAETPLHVAVTTYTPDTQLLQELAATTSSLAAMDVYGCTPLDWLWLAAIREWSSVDQQRTVWRRRVARRRFLAPAFVAWKQTWENGSWLQQQTAATPAQQQHFATQQQGLLQRLQSVLAPLVHKSGQCGWVRAVCGIRCPRALRRLLVDNSVGRVYQRDPVTGRFPLHFAATQGAYYLHYRVGVFANTPHSDREPSPVLDILADYPGASRATDTAGQLPLHIAIDHQQHHADPDDLETIEALLQAHPGAVERRDGVTKLVPCLQAAVGPRARLNTVYRLLRFQPLVVLRSCGDDREGDATMRCC